MGEFLMPSLGADMDAGRLTDWLVQPGDEVHRGDIVAVVDTAKSAIEVEVFEEGRIGELLVEPGTEVPVGTPLATIVASEGSEAEAEPAAPEAEPEAAAPELESEPAEPEPEPAEAEPEAAEPEAAAPEPAVPDIAEPSAARLAKMASPPVRHLAAQRGVDLGTVHATGRGGRITRADVERAAQPPAAPGRRRVSPRARRLAAERGIELAAVQGETISGADIPDAPAAAPSAKQPSDRTASMRQTTAALMARAAREIPHYYVSTTVDAQPMLHWLAEHNADLPVRRRVLPIAVLLRAATVAASAVGDLNGHWVDDAFVPGDGVHLGVATATRGGGLVTPALRHAEQDDTDALMARLTDLVRRARRGSLRSSEIAPGTLTVSSLADGGPDALYGVIYPPQVALVGVGGIAERPWAVSGMLTVRPTVTVTLAADHRATDGRTGAAFLEALTAALGHPEEL
jgi:pyruvate dehydrogenase E2 component (dihydrolipoamide acetyltransferase)